MGVTEAERERALKVIKIHNGKHGNTVNHKLQNEFDCGSKRAENILRNLVKKDLIHFKEFRVYLNGGI